MSVKTRATWRSPLLGEVREIELGATAIRCHERGTGEPLVFVHGVLSNANVWRGVVDHLAADFRCCTLDLPLGAHTLAMPGADRSPRGLARLIADAIDALGLAPATLVGNDTGAALCQMVAAHHGERLGRLVLTSCEFRDNCPPLLFAVMNPLARIPGGLLFYLAPGLIRPLQRLPVAYGWLAKRGFEREVGDTYTLPSLLSGAIRADFAAFLRDYHRRETIAAAELLPGFERPTLIAWSHEDRVMPPRHAEELVRLLPDARLEWIEDSYTLSPEDQPERLAELIAGFLTQTRHTVPSENRVGTATERS
jgi:pimeloyl-ACP methyl ester carboxylesterase